MSLFKLSNQRKRLQKLESDFVNLKYNPYSLQKSLKNAGRDDASI